MSVYVHVGQCGNQLGEAYWQLAHALDGKQKSPVLFHDPVKNQKAKARCILVDTEPKVINKAIQQIGPAASHVEQYGRGNNWAMGSNKSLNRQLMQQVMDSFRKEVETIDRFSSTILMQSLGGGTGSGFGSVLMENLRDSYPKPYLVNIVVAPSNVCGDTPLQNYNSLFTLKHLQQYSDVVIYKENDELLRLVAYWHKLRKKIASRISLTEVNQLVACDVAGLFFPSNNNNGNNQRFDAANFVFKMCPMSSLKFLDVRTGIFGASNSSFCQSVDPPKADDSVLKLCHFTLQSYSKGTSKSIFINAIARGFYNSTKKDQGQNIKRLEQMCCKVLPKVGWSHSESSDIQFAPPNIRMNSKQYSSFTVSSNRNSISNSLIPIRNKAALQFDAKAYIHWYQKYGVEELDFHEAFESCNNIIEEYNSFCR